MGEGADAWDTVDTVDTSSVILPRQEEVSAVSIVSWVPEEHVERSTVHLKEDVSAVSAVSGPKQILDQYLTRADWQMQTTRSMCANAMAPNPSRFPRWQGVCAPLIVPHRPGWSLA